MNELELKQNRRNQILAAEAKLKEMPQVEMPPVHHFSKGVYGREITIPADTIVIGKIHKFESLNILAHGEMTLLTEEGVKKIKAPYIVSSKAGIKRMAYTHTDCTWITVHGTEETDLEKIEAEVIAKDYSEVIDVDVKNFMEEVECLGLQ